MKDNPVLFTGEMVRAILAGRKTQTRRAVKESVFKKTAFGQKMMEGEAAEWCPFGAPGEKLWVRETQRIVDIGHRRDCTDEGTCDVLVRYEADGAEAWYEYPERLRWNPVVGHCLPYGGFRESSRLTLNVTDVRVEGVRDISQADAIAEGFDMETCASVLNKASGKIEPLDACWLTHKDGEEYDCGGYWCSACANKLAAAHGLDIDGNWGAAHETDGPANCNKCSAPLMMSLSEYGIDRELFLEVPSEDDRERYSAKGTDAAIAAMIAGGIGDLKDRQKGRLAQIGFATYWDSMAKPGDKFADNPWVFVRSFDVVEMPGR